mmetsp:Transcript_16816/g.38992  ORF Transcript_16816/g.38992 Transcript_16816/m.38992 type:complete len:113 (-) Transcript_16816:4-342(-)
MPSLCKEGVLRDDASDAPTKFCPVLEMSDCIDRGFECFPEIDSETSATAIKATNTRHCLVRGITFALAASACEAKSFLTGSDGNPHAIAGESATSDSTSDCWGALEHVSPRN